MSSMRDLQSSGLRCSSLLIWLVWLGAPAALAAADPRVGQPMDLAVYGRRISGPDFAGVEWDAPHDIHEVRVVLRPQTDAAAVEKLKLEWWGSVWPNTGRGGWQKLDDPFNGKWVRVNSTPVKTSEPAAWAFQFPPLTKDEWKEAADPAQFSEQNGPRLRRTLKVRLAGDSPLPEGLRLEVYGSTRYIQATFDIEVRRNHEQETANRIEIINGRLLHIESLPPPRAVEVRDHTWTGRGVAGGTGGVRATILFAKNSDQNSNDLTRVTLRFGADADAAGCSFVPQDVLNEDAMRLPDLGVLISESTRGITLANDPGPSDSHWRRTVRQRVADHPEATYQSAMKGIPRLNPPQWVPLGVPCARQEVFVDAGGNWGMWNASLHTESRDSQRSIFRDKEPRARFNAILDTRESPKFDGGDRETVIRYLEENWLPAIHAEWRTGPLRFHQTIVSTILIGDLGDDEKRRGDETVVMLARLEVTNHSPTTQTATVNLRYTHDAPLKLQDDGIIAIQPRDPAKVPAELTALRGQISVDQPAGGDITGWTLQPATESGQSAALRWQAALEPGQSRRLYFKQTYVDLLDEVELKRLKEISFEQEISTVFYYWRKRLENGMRVELPEPALNTLYAANLWHNAITTDRDPKTGLYNQGVGTYGYKVFANETVMIARSMDMRGEHKEAERFIEPMLHFQGNEALTGRYSTKEGVFHSAGEYTHGQYAMNHGFVMWGAADHYLMTRDRAYLDRIAPKLVKGCDFLINERKATMTPPGAPERSPVHGLSPASSLEDVIDFQYWFATNGYFYMGMKRVADALADIDHPEAKRIADEAEKYRQDIVAALREATTRAAVVKLRDGLFIPYVPPRVFDWRHLTTGWIREALYCSLHLATAHVLPPDDPLMTWMLDELEDNIYFSGASGYGVADVDKNWFERGAVTLQPCLVDAPTIYMARNEVPAALRSFWNTYALLIYPDANCFAEWAPAFGKGGGPLYKTADESRFMMWMRQLLVWEDGDRLWLARGAPREWLEAGKTIRIEHAPTLFGPAGVVIRSEADRGRIQATLTLPTRNPPAEVWLRLRYPGGKRCLRVFINDQAIAAERIVGEDIRIFPGESASSLEKGGPIQLTAEYER